MHEASKTANGFGKYKHAAIWDAWAKHMTSQQLLRDQPKPIQASESSTATEEKAGENTTPNQEGITQKIMDMLNQQDQKIAELGEGLAACMGCVADVYHHTANSGIEERLQEMNIVIDNHQYIIELHQETIENLEGSINEMMETQDERQNKTDIAKADKKMVPTVEDLRQRFMELTSGKRFSMSRFDEMRRAQEHGEGAALKRARHV